MQWHGYLMAIIYILAGVFHFISPKVYLRIMPDYIPSHKLMVILSGIVEILLGIFLLFQITRIIAVYGIIFLLILFLSVHIEMLLHKKKRLRLPLWVLIVRIPLQFGLMYWAYIYSI